MKQLETEMPWLNIRYSIDNTGNNPNGNWILESDVINIKNIYFTDKIKAYTHILDNICLVDETNTIPEIEYDSTSMIYTLISDLDLSKYDSESGWNSANGDYILQLNTGQTFDGNRNKILIPDERNTLQIGRASCRERVCRDV